MPTPGLKTLQTYIDNITTSNLYSDIVTISAQIDGQTQNIGFYVANVSSLPDLNKTCLPDGTGIFVDSLCGIVVKSFNEWITIDKKLIRKDNSSSIIWTWGDNGFGQLGIDNSVNFGSPITTIGSDSNWCAISGGLYHTMSIKTDGTLWTWGRNNYGQLGIGTTSNRSSPGTTAGGGTTWCQVSAGSSHSGALKTDGTLWTWGRNNYGQLGIGTTTNRSSPGTVVGGGTTWCQFGIGFGATHTAAIKTDGTLWTWGRNNVGQLGDGTTTNRSSPGTTAGGGTTWCQVHAGTFATGAIKTDCTLWTWGCNLYGILGDGTTTNRSSPGTTADSGTNWCLINIGSCHASGIKTDGTLWTWGSNFRRLLGVNSPASRSSPDTTSGGGTTWCQVSLGGVHSLAIKTDSTIWTWGYNTRGQTASGGYGSPGTTLGCGNSWCKISAGFLFSLGINKF